MENQNMIEYQKCYVAFLDILGFEKLVKSNDDRSKDKIESYFRLINDEVNKLKEISSKRDIGTLIISDSVILSVRKTNDIENDIEKLRQLCIAIRKIQYSLALNNVWLRGGVSSGDAFFSSSESQIVGPAYIDAYNLEKRVAVYPRVVVDTKLINELGCDSADSLINKINNDHAKQNEYDIEDRNVIFQWRDSGHEKVGMKKDVALFIDYLAPSFAQCSNLKLIIDNLVESMYQDNQVYPKYRWIVDYLMARCIPLNQFNNEESVIINTQFDRLRCL